MAFPRQLRAHQSHYWSLSDCPPLTNKVAVITGGQSGPGAEITKQLLLHDISQVVVLSKSRERFEKTRDEHWIPSLENQGLGRERVERARFVECDLADLRIIERVGRDLTGLGPGGLKRLDMLFLSAALLKTPTHEFSPQGIEIVFAVNHLGHFHLTQILLPLLTITLQTCCISSTRIIVTSSTNYYHCNELSLESTCPPVRTASFDVLDDFAYRYSRSKLANILFTRALSKRLPENMFANVYTVEGDSKTLKDPRPFGTPLINMDSYSPPQDLEDGTATALFLAVSDEVEKGNYRGECWTLPGKREQCSALARDYELAERLWYWSEEIVEKGLLKDVEDNHTGVWIWPHEGWRKMMF